MVVKKALLLSAEKPAKVPLARSVEVVPMYSYRSWMSPFGSRARMCFPSGLAAAKTAWAIVGLTNVSLSVAALYSKRSVWPFESPAPAMSSAEVKIVRAPSSDIHRDTGLVDGVPADASFATPLWIRYRSDGPPSA